MKKYECGPCGYEYDPAVGDPDGGIAPGTEFKDIPDDWVCPVCGANLNETECGCDTFVPDPRLAGLGDILEKMKQKEV